MSWAGVKDRAVLEAERFAAYRNAPVALWLEDHSAARARLEELGLIEMGAAGRLVDHLTANPSLLRSVVDLVRIVDVNDAVLQRYEYGTLDELCRDLTRFYSDSTYAIHAWFWQALCQGQSRFTGEDTNTTPKGRVLRQEVTYVVQPGAEPTWDRVIVCDVDLTSRLLAERSMRLQRDTALALATCDDADELLERLLDTLLTIEDVFAAGVYLPDPDTGDFVLAAQRGLSTTLAAATARHPVGSPRLAILSGGEVLQRTYTQLVEDLGDLSRGAAPELRDLLCIASVPILRGGQLVTIVNIGSCSIAAFPQATVSLVEAIAVTASDALQRIAAQRENENRLRYLAALGEIQRALMARPDADIGSVALPRLLEVSGADRVYLLEASDRPREGQRHDRVTEAAGSVAPRMARTEPSGRPYDRLPGAWREALQLGKTVSGRRTDFPDQAAEMDQHDVLAVLLLPLFVHGEVWGLLGFDNCHVERAWDSHEIALLTSAAAAVSAALEQEQATLRERAESARLQALLDAGRALSGSLDYDEVLATVARRAGEALGSAQCVVWEYLPETDQEFFRALYEREPEPGLAEKLQGARHPLEDFPGSRSILFTGEVRELTLSDRHLHPSIRESMLEWGEKTLLTVPLTRSGEPLGELILVETEAERSFTPSERELARGLGELAATALANARLHSRVQEQLDVRHDLLHLGESLLSQLDEQQVFDHIADALGSLVAFDALELGIVDPLARQVEIVNATGKDADIVLGQRFPMDAGVTGRVLQEGKAALVNDMLRDPDGELVPGTESEEQAAIIVPLRLGADRAVLTLDRFGGRFTQDETETVRLFANLAAVALENARLYRTLEEQAISDGLTGLYNHRHFYERLDQELARSGRTAEPVALLMIDIDDFKQLNDRYGHPAGDDVLRIVGRVLRVCTRHGVDVAARYGGEEFAVILPAAETQTPAGGTAEAAAATGGAAVTDAAEAAGPAGGAADAEVDAGTLERRSAVAVAERIRAAIWQESSKAAAEHKTAGRTAAASGHKTAPQGVTVSVGVSVYPTPAATMDALVAQADAALYLAKQRGKDRVEVYTPG